VGCREGVGLVWWCMGGDSADVVGACQALVTDACKLRSRVEVAAEQFGAVVKELEEQLEEAVDSFENEGGAVALEEALLKVVHEPHQVKKVIEVPSVRALCSQVEVLFHKRAVARQVKEAMFSGQAFDALDKDEETAILRMLLRRRQTAEGAGTPNTTSSSPSVKSPGTPAHKAEPKSKGPLRHLRETPDLVKTPSSKTVAKRLSTGDKSVQRKRMMDKIKHSTPTSKRARQYEYSVNPETQGKPNSYLAAMKEGVQFRQLVAMSLAKKYAKKRELERKVVPSYPPLDRLEKPADITRLSGLSGVGVIIGRYLTHVFDEILLAECTESPKVFSKMFPAFTSCYHLTRCRFSLSEDLKDSKAYLALCEQVIDVSDDVFTYLFNLVDDYEIPKTPEPFSAPDSYKLRISEESIKEFQKARRVKDLLTAFAESLQ